MLARLSSCFFSLQAGDCLGNLAALPAIYHYWIAGCLVFLIQLCRPDRIDYQKGLFAEGQLEDTHPAHGRDVRTNIPRGAFCEQHLNRGRGRRMRGAETSCLRGLLWLSLTCWRAYEQPLELIKCIVPSHCRFPACELNNHAEMR